MKIEDLRLFIKNLVPGTYFNNGFPVGKNIPDKCSAVKLTGGFPVSQWTGKKQPSFQIRVRGANREESEVESRAYEIHEALTNLRNVKIGNASVVIIRAMNTNPIPLGEDENGRLIYTMNFDTVVRPK